MQRIAEGQIVVPLNTNRPGRIVGIGMGLRSKVNASIGTSTDIVDIGAEVRKARAAEAAGADTLMELSVGGDLDEVRREVLAAVSLPVGNVPLYQAFCEASRRYGDPNKLDEELLFDLIEKQCADGISFMAIHCGTRPPDGRWYGAAAGRAPRTAARPDRDWRPGRAGNDGATAPAASVSSIALASALRGWPSSSAISPNTSPGLMTLSVISLPSDEIALMRTRPRSTAIIESPVSPFWKMVCQRRMAHRRRTGGKTTQFVGLQVPEQEMAGEQGFPPAPVRRRWLPCVRAHIAPDLLWNSPEDTLAEGARAMNGEDRRTRSTIQWANDCGRVLVRRVAWLTA